MKYLIPFLGLLLHCGGMHAEYATCAFRGQLGNQMFEIATTVAYALDHKKEPSFPTLKYAERGFPQFLEYYPQIPTFPIEDCETIQYYEDEHTDYLKYFPIPSFEHNDVCLNGFFQSYKYFDHHRDTIIALFSPPPEIITDLYEKYSQLLKIETVALHIRTFIPDGRADPENWDYYENAMNQFTANEQFLIFSDVIEWVESHFPDKLRQRNCRFIKNESFLHDFYLMSMCDHQIISPESTFSWWAAYLNQNPRKRVIIPETWSGRTDAETIVPGWETVSMTISR